MSERWNLNANLQYFGGSSFAYWREYEGTERIVARLRGLPTGEWMKIPVMIDWQDSGLKEQPFE